MWVNVCVCIMTHTRVNCTGTCVPASIIQLTLTNRTPPSCDLPTARVTQSYTGPLFAQWRIVNHLELAIALPFRVFRAVIDDLYRRNQSAWGTGLNKVFDFLTKSSLIKCESWEREAAWMVLDAKPTKTIVQLLRIDQNLPSLPLTTRMNIFQTFYGYPKDHALW